MGLYIVGSYADPHITRPYMGSHPFQRTAQYDKPSCEDKSIVTRWVGITIALPFLNGQPHQWP